MSDISSDYGSEENLVISKSKRIGRLLKRDEGGTGSGAQLDTGLKNPTESVIPDLDNFLDPTANEDLIDANLLVEQQLMRVSPTPDGMLDTSATELREESEPMTKKPKAPKEKRAPNSKKTLMEMKRTVDAMVRSAPLDIDELVEETPAQSFNICSFLQRFQISKENRTEQKLAEEVSPVEVTSTPLTRKQILENVMAETVLKLAAVSNKPLSLLTPKIKLGNPAEVRQKAERKSMTHMQLNAYLTGLMAERSLKKKESIPIDENVKGELYDDIVYSTEEEAESADKTAELSEAENANHESSHQGNGMESPETDPNDIKSQTMDGTVQYQDTNLELGTAGKTQLLQSNRDSELDQSNPFASSDSIFNSKNDLVDPTQDIKLLNITRQTVASTFYAENSSLESHSSNPSEDEENQKEISEEPIEGDSDEEVIIRKVPRRQQENELDVEVSDDDMTEKPTSLKRLVKKDVNVLNEDAGGSIKGKSSPPFRNQFVADQADEEDEEGVVIQYSGSEEDMDDNEYDLDELEVESDFGSVNHDAIRELHHKFEKDAENRGYNLLTRKGLGANRIFGNDDEGHQFSRRQRNRYAGQAPYGQDQGSSYETPAEERLVADFVPSGVNNVRDLGIRLPRSNTARRQMPLHSSLTAAQVAQAWNDPNPRMAFLRASSTRVDPKEAPKIPIADSFVLRAGRQHNLLTRTGSNSSGSIAIVPSITAPLLKNPFPTYLRGHPTSSLTIADPAARASHLSQLKRQFDTKAPEGKITKLSRTNARRFGYANFKVYGKRSEFPDLFPEAQKKP